VNAGEDVKKGRLNPTALPVEAAARLLTAAGGARIEAEHIRADIDAGAPTNPDGTLNLVHYAAWMVQQAGDRRLKSGGRNV
jgi:hypothetical protein